MTSRRRRGRGREPKEPEREPRCIMQCLGASGRRETHGLALHGQQPGAAARGAGQQRRPLHRCASDSLDARLVVSLPRSHLRHHLPHELQALQLHPPRRLPHRRAPLHVAGLPRAATEPPEERDQQHQQHERGHGSADQEHKAHKSGASPGRRLVLLEALGGGLPASGSGGMGRSAGRSGRRGRSDGCSGRSAGCSRGFAIGCHRRSRNSRRRGRGHDWRGCVWGCGHDRRNRKRGRGYDRRDCVWGRGHDRRNRRRGRDHDRRGRS
mmetsp:Transcript_53386/g.139137  ORF Transcript_53386/g.139137 Transcript_53386/m.139137 type:complete len:267 (-) Transcript_53386:243-1043(-)